MGNYFFRDLDHRGSLQDGVEWNPCGAVIGTGDIPEKDIVVIFYNPFKDEVCRQWRSESEVVLMPVDDAVFDEFCARLNKMEDDSPMLSKKSEWQIEALIREGFNFYLSYETSSVSNASSWWADFNKRFGSRWENYEPGEAETPDAAINEAYCNIRNGLKMFSTGAHRTLQMDNNEQ